MRVQPGAPCAARAALSLQMLRMQLACFNGKNWEWEDQTITKCECSLVRPALRVQLDGFRR